MKARLSVPRIGGVILVVVALSLIAPATLTRSAGHLTATDNDPRGTLVVASGGGMTEPPPATLYVSSVGGVFRSDDGGESWTPVGSGLSTVVGEALGVRLFAVDPTTTASIYGVQSHFNQGYGSIIFRSSDRGIRWEAVSDPLDFSIYSLIVDPQTPTTLYVGSYRGVHKSVDSGRTWILTAHLTARPPDFTGDEEGFLLAFDPVRPTTIYAGGVDGVFKSDDSGVTWRAISDGLDFAAEHLAPTPIHAIAVDPTNPDVVYLGKQGGVFKTVDGGRSWEQRSTGLPQGFCLPPPDVICFPAGSVSALAIDPRTPDVIFAGSLGGTGVYRSSDGGQTWTLTNTPRIGSVRSIVLDPLVPGTVYTGSSRSDGVQKSVDGGSTWRAINTGLPGGGVLTLAIAR